MQNIITLDVLSAVSEKEFSLDELVIAAKTLSAQDGMAGMIGLILRLVDEKICMEVAEVVSEQSYRRSSSHLDLIGIALPEENEVGLTRM